MSTQDTFVRHLQALSGGIDAIMRDYTESSVLFTQQGQLTGLQSIRGFFARFLGDSPPELLAAFTLLRQDVAGEVAYILMEGRAVHPAGGGHRRDPGREDSRCRPSPRSRRHPRRTAPSGRRWAPASVRCS